MSDPLPSLDPDEAALRFGEMLEEAGLPRFSSTRYSAATAVLELFWNNGNSIGIFLERDELSPIDDWDRATILDEPLPCGCELHVTVPSSSSDPREEVTIPGLEIHRSPALHPDDITVVDGVRVTSPSRTLIDLAEVLTADELREAFAAARARGLLDPDALRASRARVEWRPSLAMLDAIMEEFLD